MEFLIWIVTYLVGFIVMILGDLLFALITGGRYAMGYLFDIGILVLCGIISKRLSRNIDKNKQSSTNKENQRAYNPLFSDIKYDNSVVDRVKQVGMYSYIAENIACAFVFSRAYWMVKSKEELFEIAFKISTVSYYLRGIVTSEMISQIAKDCSQMSIEDGLVSASMFFSVVEVTADTSGATQEAVMEEAKKHLKEMRFSVKCVLDQGKNHPVYRECGDAGYKKLFSICQNYDSTIQSKTDEVEQLDIFETKESVDYKSSVIDKSDTIEQLTIATIEIPDKLKDLAVSDFLCRNIITCCDTVIFSCFVIRALLVGTGTYGPKVLEFSDSYIEGIKKHLKEKYPSTTAFFDDLFSNRTQFYDRIFMSKPGIENKIPAILEEFEYIIKTDIISGKYNQFFEESPLPVLGMPDDFQCQLEVSNFFKLLPELVSPHYENVQDYIG